MAGASSSLWQPALFTFSQSTTRNDGAMPARVAAVLIVAGRSSQELGKK